MARFECPSKEEIARWAGDDQPEIIRYLEYRHRFRRYGIERAESMLNSLFGLFLAVAILSLLAFFRSLAEPTGPETVSFSTLLIAILMLCLIRIARAIVRANY